MQFTSAETCGNSRGDGLVQAVGAQKRAQAAADSHVQEIADAETPLAGVVVSSAMANRATLVPPSARRASRWRHVPVLLERRSARRGARLRTPGCAQAGLHGVQNLAEIRLAGLHSHIIKNDQRSERFRRWTFRVRTLARQIESELPTGGAPVERALPRAQPIVAQPPATTVSVSRVPVEA